MTLLFCYKVLYNMRLLLYSFKLNKMLCTMDIAKDTHGSLMVRNLALHVIEFTNK